MATVKQPNLPLINGNIFIENLGPWNMQIPNPRPYRELKDEYKLEFRLTRSYNYKRYPCQFRLRHKDIIKFEFHQVIIYTFDVISSKVPLKQVRLVTKKPNLPDIHIYRHVYWSDREKYRKQRHVKYRHYQIVTGSGKHRQPLLASNIRQ